MQITKMNLAIRVVTLTLSFTAFSLLWTNCSPPKPYSTTEDTSVVMNIIREPAGSNPTPEGPQSKALLNFNQVYSSMLNLTDQLAAPTGTQNQAYNSLVGSLAESSSLQKVTGSGLLASNSLAGEVCNGFLSKESGVTAAQRKFLPMIDFSKAPTDLTEATYLNSVQSLSDNFLGRQLAAAELALFKEYRTDFVNDLMAAEKTQNKFTRVLMLTTCTTILSSFDSFTY